MAFIPALNTAKVAIEWVTSAGLFAVNTLWFRNDVGAWTVGNLDLLCNEIESSIIGQANRPYPDSVSVGRITARDYTTQNGITAQEIGQANTAGTLTSPMLPANVTIAVKMNTGLAGRSFRGRIYHPGLTEDGTTGSLIDQTRATNIVNFWNTIMVDVNSGAQVDLVVASFYSNKQPRLTATLTPVTEFSLTDRRVDTQRKRLDNQGAI